jgi:hypothetical protein
MIHMPHTLKYPAVTCMEPKMIYIKPVSFFSMPLYSFRMTFSNSLLVLEKRLIELKF